MLLIVLVISKNVKPFLHFDLKKKSIEQMGTPIIEATIARNVRALLEPRMPMQ